MGYYNMIFQYGENNFLNKCKTSGVNGLIVVDLPWPENKKFASKCKKKSIFFIQLLSPTTTKNRLKKIIKELKQSKDCIVFIDEIDGIAGGCAYWQLLHNGESSMVGASTLLLAEGDSITWNYNTDYC